jgi:phosphoribosyl-ATP pyrophosphohydrolase/phosphoribosyl-AMP cyclohydrolase
MDIRFEKYSDGLVPAIVQDSSTGTVLMLGFMNEEAMRKTVDTGKVTFFSRSKQRLWTKGETSGNFLELESLSIDCDSDTILVKAHPVGPVCHDGTDTCFGEENRRKGFLYELEDTIKARKVDPRPDSYTSQLFSEGVGKISQKVGEEAIETVIEAMGDDKDRLKNESADLLYHLLVLLVEKEVPLSQVVDTLKKRAK